MIPVADIAQMRECDRITIEELGIPGLVLMENASRAVAFEALERLGEEPSGKIAWVFCGKGNNGGDGFAVARHLKNAGVVVHVVLMGRADGLKGDARFNCELFRRLGGGIIESKGDEPPVPPGGKPDLVIDALLGTGFTGVVQGGYASAVELINRTGAPVIAVDIPSGVEGDTGAVNGPAVQADVTVTFGLLKRGLLLPPGREAAGEVIVADIGIPPAVVNRQDIRLNLVGEPDVRRAMPRRLPTAHKGDAGHVYIIAGSTGLTGAAAMAAKAAMRTGTGLVVVGVPRSLNPILEVKLDEAMTQPLAETAAGALSVEAFDEISPRLEWAQVVVIGPGLGRDPATSELIAKLLPVIDRPLVIDADGLNHLAEHPELLQALPEATILTPHPGEFARLTGLTTKRIRSDPVGAARQWALEWGATVVLKGSPTVTATADERVYINPTGNSGMATGGTGDVLTGVVAGLVAQGVDPRDAAWLGAYIHGAAGDRARETKGTYGLVAGDLVDYLPETMADFV